jgi:ABC-type glycerol-3-phosphate transport system permease component
MWNVIIAGTIFFIILWLVAYYFINEYIQKVVNEQKLKEEYKM